VPAAQCFPHGGPLASESSRALLLRPFPKYIQIILSAMVMAAAAWFGTRPGFYTTCALNPFLAFTLAGFALIHIRLQPKWTDAVSIVAATLLGLWIDVRFLHYEFGLYAALGILGLVSIAAIAVRGISLVGAERKRLTVAFAFALLTVGSNAAAGIVHNWIARLTPRVLDLYLCVFDGSLHVQPSFLMGQAYSRWHWFGQVGMFVYLGFALVIALVFVGQLIRDRNEIASTMTAFLITGPLGVFCYGLFPALGPLYIFRNRFPWYPLSIIQLSQLRLGPVELPGYRNSMPSLHVVWVLLALWYSRSLSVWTRATAALFLLFTLFATLGSGEHYFVDLIVAFPFALFIYGVSAINVPWNRPQRRLAALCGLGMTLLWVELLRFDVSVFWVSPLIPWVACAATVALSCVLQLRLVRAAATPNMNELSEVAPVAFAVSSS
jgi:hypothetical protein